MDKKHSYKISVILIVVFLAAAGMLLLAARRADGFAQWYAMNVYPLLVGTIGRLSGIFPFSVAEKLCFLLPVLVIADLIISVIRKKIGGALLRFVLLGSILLFLYSACCGVNYYSDPHVSKELIEKNEITEADLEDFCNYVADQLNENNSDNNFIIDNIAENADSGTYNYPSDAELTEKAVSAMQSVGDERLDGYYPHPKMLSNLAGFFSSMGVTGIYSPFTVEANVNGEIPGMQKPFTACHELSHLRGFMNEGEANYIGWLACIHSDDEAFRRSGWIIAYSYAGNALYKADPDLFEELRKKVPDSVIRELKDNHEFWDAHMTEAAEVQDKVNDAYLKSNGLEDGVESYGKVLTLMLIWYKTADLSER